MCCNLLNLLQILQMWIGNASMLALRWMNKNQFRVLFSQLLSISSVLLPFLAISTHTQHYNASRIRIGKKSDTNSRRSVWTEKFEFSIFARASHFASAMVLKRAAFVCVSLVFFFYFMEMWFKLTRWIYASWVLLKCNFFYYSQDFLCSRTLCTFIINTRKKGTFYFLRQKSFNCFRNCRICRFFVYVKKRLAPVLGRKTERGKSQFRCCLNNNKWKIHMSSYLFIFIAN
jgi:hypothetical protein